MNKQNNKESKTEPIFYKENNKGILVFRNCGVGDGLPGVNVNKEINKAVVLIKT